MPELLAENENKTIPTRIKGVKGGVTDDVKSLFPKKSIKEQVLEEFKYDVFRENATDADYNTISAASVNKNMEKAIDLTEQLTRKECEERLNWWINKFSVKIGFLMDREVKTEKEVFEAVDEIIEQAKADERRKTLGEIIEWLNNLAKGEIYDGGNKELVEAGNNFAEFIKNKTLEKIFAEIEKLFEEVMGCSNPFCQGYPDKEYLWENLKREFDRK